MTHRFVTLPNGCACSLGVYVAAWRKLKATQPSAQVRNFFHFPEAASLVLEELENGLHARINAHDERYGRGRKWDAQYQIALRRDARRVQDIARRIRVYQFETIEARSRFGHRLAHHHD